LIDNSPVFILGVPRSGTTLLRVLFDSHPQFACGPEAPWLARGAHSLKQLYYYMADDKFGYVANFGVSREVLRDRFASYVNSIFMAYAEKKGKSRWVEKTPDNCLDIPFLIELFPDAKFIHIVRDGRDVACSTAILSRERKAISSWHSDNLLMDDGVVVKNTIHNAALRWEVWNRIIEENLEKAKHKIIVKYEDLVTETHITLTHLLEFIGEEYVHSMTDIEKFHHDLPEWEWGSRDIKRAKGISKRSLARWEKQLLPREISQIEASVGATLLKYGYKLTSGAKNTIGNDNVPNNVRLASVSELKSMKFRWFMLKMNYFAGKHGLRKFTNWSKVWEYPWLWYNILSSIEWNNVRVLDLGSEISPMPWYLASLGAKVTLIECDQQWIPIWEKIKKQTGYSIDWKIVSNETLPFTDDVFDVVTSFSVIEHQSDKIKAIEEVVRVLKPSGLFVISFDICENDMGMMFPEWNGTALTMKEFEEIIWTNPSLTNNDGLVWNLHDIDRFVKWHLRSAQYHNYTVGACYLRKKSND